jgi:tetratricopeptide (TPR) repeat protein
MREIARRAGRGKISSSTVHNVFSDSRVPRWDFLELILKALGAEHRREEFLGLWVAADRAQTELGAQGNSAADPARLPGRTGPDPEDPPWSYRPGVSPVEASIWPQMPPRQPQRIWSNEIPSRNLNFTGRTDELAKISQNLDSHDPPRVQVVSGMGGIGKTELATEYVHRNIDKYDIIWWIRAEHHDRIREALVSLARRLELRASTDGDRDMTIAAVLEKLQSDSAPKWLLVYDNATNPPDLQKYLATSKPGGHVVVTSRELTWPAYLPADSVEVEPFTPEEAVSYLRHRVPGLGPLGVRGARSSETDASLERDAARLAEGLGYLPIAIDHAAAYLTETGEDVDQYLTLFARNAHSLLEEQPGEHDDSHARVSGTWAMSNELLTTDARHLFNLCAFFSPEPIAADLFLQSAPDIADPPGLAEFLSSDRRFRAAARQLHRLSLAKFDGARDLIQVHRVVQAVTKGRLENSADLFDAYSAAVDALLAQSNPRNPDRGDSDAVYDLSLQHLESDRRFLQTSNPGLRDLIIDQVRRLHLRGAHVEAMLFGQDALQVWRDCHGEDDLKVLAMAVEVSVAMYMGGRVADAHELILQTRRWLQRYSDQDGYKIFLLCENIYGAVLRARSQFREALELDLGILPQCADVFGEKHERTLSVRHNIAFDYRQLGQFNEALETDKRTLDDRRQTLGPTAQLTLYSEYAVARDLRDLGFYQESLDRARKVANAFEAVGRQAGGRENPHWLLASEGFATALRKAGFYWEARQESEHVLQRYRDYLGADHMFTVIAATNLINDLRAVGDLAGALDLARETYDRCQRTSPPDDILYAAQLNLASVLRMVGDTHAALSNDDQARRGLVRIYSDRHPFTLAASINYATDLAACRRLGEAIKIGMETLAKCRESLGDNHPDTLMAAANLSVDEAAAGDRAGAELRRSEALRGYADTLTLEHPDAREAAQGKRLTAEIEPVV